MAGIDEGINWEAVISEAKREQSYLNGFESSFNCVLSHFALEMSFIWASGHAVDFGKLLDTKENEIRDLGKQYARLFASYINNAIRIYKDNFAVAAPTYEPNYEASINSSRLGYAGYCKFEETKNGMSGMNKKAVADAIATFQKNMKDFADKFKENTSSVHISIFDHAGAQKAAFNHMVAEMVKALNDAAAEIIGEAQKNVDIEIENMLLAQNQTVNTFIA